MAFVTRNKFGNKQVVVGLKVKKNPDFPQGYVEISGKLYKLTLSRSKKEGIEYWVTIEKTEKLDNKGF